MRILVEILHPAHVHMFRNAIVRWRERGDEVLVLSREKDCANELLDGYGIAYQSISRLGRRKASLPIEMIVRDVRMFRQALRFKPDVLVGVMGVTIAQVGPLIRKPAIVFYDTEHATLTNRFVYKLAHSVCTPDCYGGHVNGRHVTYPGYHELAYLHPDLFSPDPDKVREVGIDPEERFFIVRFVSWQASHDLGGAGLNIDFKTKIVRKLAKHGRVLITSEADLPAELERYRCGIPPELMHDVLAYADLLVGESGTMASEAAVLGVPAFFVSGLDLGYLEEQETKYGLVFNFEPDQEVEISATLDELLAMADIRAEFRDARTKLLTEKINVTNWLIDYVDSVVAETQCA